MIQIDFTVVQLICDTTITISALVFVVNGSNFSFDTGILILFTLSLVMLVESRPGQLSDFQQHIQLILLPQFLDHHYFFFWCRSLSRTKACNFFRYAFSALSR